MTIKDTIKSLIALKQQEIPVAYNPRDIELPIDASKIITVVGVRRCGKSTLMELCIERLFRSGVSPRQIVWIGFDDERFDGMQTSDFNSIIEVYMEMFPDIVVKSRLNFSGQSFSSTSASNGILVRSVFCKLFSEKKQ